MSYKPVMERPVIALTGASSGIGKALAVELARARGARLALMARRAQELELVADLVREAGGEALTIPVDVTDRAAMAKALSRIEAELGPIDVAIANAGIGAPMPAEAMDLDNCERTMRVNYDGALNLLGPLVPKMLARGRGHLVGICSIAAYRGLPTSAPYCASKAALTSFLESLRIETLPKGVPVTIVHPGFVRTPMTDVNEFPMPFMVEVEDAARLLERKLRKAPRVIEFPWQLVWLAKLGRLLPGWLYDRTVAGRA